MKRPDQTTTPRRDAPNGGPGRLASEGEKDGTVDPNDSGGKPVPTLDPKGESTGAPQGAPGEPQLDPSVVPPPNTGARP